MKNNIINFICLLIIVLGLYFGYNSTKNSTELHTTINSVVELQVHLSSLPQPYPNQVYVIQDTLGDNQAYVFDDISQINLPESNWKIYLVTYADVPTEKDKQIAPRSIRFMYKNGVYDTDQSTQIDQANTQEAKLIEVSAQATAQSVTGYQPGSSIEINNSNCVAVGIDGNTQNVNCNLTPQP